MSIHQRFAEDRNVIDALHESDKAEELNSVEKKNETEEEWNHLEEECALSVLRGQHQGCEDKENASNEVTVNEQVVHNDLGMGCEDCFDLRR